MSQNTDKQRAISDRVRRLRERLERLKHSEGVANPLTGIVAGILDLLEDEL